MTARQSGVNKSDIKPIKLEGIKTQQRSDSRVGGYTERCLDITLPLSEAQGWFDKAKQIYEQDFEANIHENFIVLRVPESSISENDS